MLAGGERMTPDLFALAPKFRVIARTGVGYDLIDVAAASAHKVAVTITPGTNQDSVAEQTLALLLALARRIVPNDRVIHGGGWDRALVAPVRGKTLGLVGMGRIGRAVAAARPGVPDAGRRVRHDPRRRIRRAARHRAAVARRAAGDLGRRQPAPPPDRSDPRHGQPRLPGQDARRART